MEIIEGTDLEIAIFKLEGRLDSISSETLDARIDQILQNGAKHLVIDCEHLDYITSAGLRVLNKTAKRLTRSQGKIILFAMADYVREIFEIAGFDTFLPIVATYEDAKRKI